MITLLKDCFDFSSWNSRVRNVIAFTVTMLLLAGSGHVIYGIVHVTGQFNDMQHITNAMYALQSLQVPLQKAEHGIYNSVNRFLENLCVCTYRVCLRVFTLFLFGFTFVSALLRFPAAFYLSLATNVANATSIITLLQAQINKIYIATNQVKICFVEVIMLYVLYFIFYVLSVKFCGCSHG